MEQKRLYKTIERLADKNFESEEELLFDVLKQLIRISEIKITGGRIWKINKTKMSYSVILQSGNIHKIKKGFEIPISEYPIFALLSKNRTVLATETNATLLNSGILKYSGTGVGDKQKIDDIYYFDYMLALNSNEINENLRYTLDIVATILTSKIRERRLSSSRKNLIADIDKAKQLQRSILPEHQLNFHNYDIFGITIPAEIVGGDFYDYIKIGSDEERIGIVLGDAASKGLGAAAEAMYISGALRMAGDFQMKISPMMDKMNKLINKIFSDDKFSTLFYGELSNDKKGLFLYANAGHNPPMFYTARNRRISYLNPTGPLLGPAQNSRYETDSINFTKGDVLVIFSDGITEAANQKYEFYEEKRLVKIIKKNCSKTPKEIAISIIESVQKFSTSESKYQDDKTVVVIKRN